MKKIGEKQLKRQEVHLTFYENSIMFTSTDLQEPFEFEYEWDDVYYACHIDFILSQLLLEREK
jgi:hypothetical protein